jgi:hypothetical protein
MLGGGRWARLAYPITTAAMLYTHYYGFAVVAAQFAFLLLRRTPTAEWRRWANSVLAVMLLFAAWLREFAVQVASGRAWPSFRPTLSWTLPVYTLWGMSLGGPVVTAAGLGGWTVQGSGLVWIAMIGGVAVLLLAFATFSSPGVTRDAKVLLGLSIVLPLALAILISLRFNVFSSRYFSFITPPIALVLGAGMDAILSRPRRWAKPTAVLLVGTVVLLNITSLIGYYRMPRLDVFDWRSVAGALALRAESNDAIVFLPGFSRIPVNYYFRGPQARLALTPDGADVVGDGGVRTTAVVASLTKSPRIWIVTVPPVPLSVETMVESLAGHGFTIAGQGSVNLVRLILLKRTPNR